MNVSQFLQLRSFWLSVLAEHATHVSLQDPKTGSQIKLEDPGSHPSMFWPYGNAWYRDHTRGQPKATVAPWKAVVFVKQISVKQLPALRDIDLVVWTISAKNTENAHNNTQEAHCRHRVYPSKLREEFVSAATMLLSSVGPQLHRLRLPADDRLACGLQNWRRKQHPVLFPRLHTLSVVRGDDYSRSCVSLAEFVLTVARSITPVNGHDGETFDSCCSPLKTLSLSNVTQNALLKLAATDRFGHIRRSVKSICLSVSKRTETDWYNLRYRNVSISNIARLVGAFRGLCSFQWNGLPSRELMERVVVQASPSLCDISIHSAFNKPCLPRVATQYWLDTSSDVHYTMLDAMAVQAGEKLTSLKAVSTACDLIQTTTRMVFFSRSLDFSTPMIDACQGLKCLDIETNHATVIGLARLIQCNDGLRSLKLRVQVLDEGTTCKLLTAEGWDVLGQSIATRRWLHTVDIASFSWDRERDCRYRQWTSQEESSAVASFLLKTLQNLESPLRVFSFSVRAILTRTIQELLSIMTDVVSALTKVGQPKNCLRELVLCFDAIFDDMVTPLGFLSSSRMLEMHGCVRRLERRLWEKLRNLERLELVQLRKMIQLGEYHCERDLDEQYGADMWSRIDCDD